MLRSVVNYANNSAGKMSVVADDGRSIDLQSGSVRPLVRLRAGHRRNGEREEKESGTEGRQKETMYEDYKKEKRLARWM